MEISHDKKMPEGYLLARLLGRTAAAAIDAAIAMLLVLIMYFSCYLTIGEAVGLFANQDTLDSYAVRAGLKTKSATNVVSDIDSTDYVGYKNAVETYYFVWNASSNTDNPHPEGYDAAYYNVNVLGLPSSTSIVSTSTLFTWDVDSEGNPDSSKVGVFLASLYNSEGQLTETSKTSLKSFYYSAYDEAVKLLINEDYYSSVNAALKEKSSWLLALITLVPAILTYAVPIFFNKDRATVGKLIMKIRVVTLNGDPLPLWRALLRLIPLLLMIVVVVIIDDFVVSLSIALAIFLISMGLAFFTPRRQSMHDFLVLSVVAKKDEKDA